MMTSNHLQKSVTGCLTTRCQVGFRLDLTAGPLDRGHIYKRACTPTSCASHSYHLLCSNFTNPFVRYLSTLPPLSPQHNLKLQCASQPSSFHSFAPPWLWHTLTVKFQDTMLSELRSKFPPSTSWHWYVRKLRCMMADMTLVAWLISSMNPIKGHSKLRKS